MANRVEIRHRETGATLFENPIGFASADSDARALGEALRLAAAGGIDLSFADLHGVDARGLDLRNARLADALLNQARLDGADLSHANLSGATALQITAVGARFQGADLRSAHVWAATLDGADFRGAQASGINLEDTSLRRADLSEADFSDANLARADLAGANLQQANLEGADLQDTVADRRVTPTRHFAWRRGWLLSASSGSGAMAVLSGWMAWQVGMRGFGDLSVPGHVIIFAVLGAFALILGAASITYLLALFDRRAVVLILPSGIHDRRLSFDSVAWEDLRGFMPFVYNGQTMLALDVANPAGRGLPRNPLWALNRLSARMLGRPEFAIRMNGLDGDLQAMILAIQSAAPTARSN